MSQEILKAMAIKGYIERVKKGPDSYSILTNKDKLISDWLKEYHFDLNIVDNYYTPDKDILNVKVVRSSHLTYRNNSPIHHFLYRKKL